MSPADLRALADRVEKATGPDRGLDVDIEHARGWPDAQWTSDARRYTASLDAAVTLVPRGWTWRVGNLVSGGGFAFLGTSLKEHVAATPALALTAAALRALAAEKEGE